MAMYIHIHKYMDSDSFVWMDLNKAVKMWL